MAAHKVDPDDVTFKIGDKIVPLYSGSLDAVEPEPNADQRRNREFTVTITIIGHSFTPVGGVGSAEPDDPARDEIDVTPTQKLLTRGNGDAADG